MSREFEKEKLESICWLSAELSASDGFPVDCNSLRQVLAAKDVELLGAVGIHSHMVQKVAQNRISNLTNSGTKAWYTHTAHPRLTRLISHSHGSSLTHTAHL